MVAPTQKSTPNPSGTVRAVGDDKSSKRQRRNSDTNNDALQWLTGLPVSVILLSFFDGMTTAATSSQSASWPSSHGK